MRKAADYQNCRVRLKVPADRFDSFIAPAGIEGVVIETQNDLVVVQTDKPFDGAGKSKFQQIQYHVDHFHGSGMTFDECLASELEVIGKVDSLPPLVPSSVTGELLKETIASKKQTILQAISDLLHGLGSVDSGIECSLNETAYRSLLSLISSIYGEEVSRSVAKESNEQDGSWYFTEEAFNAFCAALNIEPGTID